MTPLCHQHSIYFQRYDTSNSDNAEKIDCEKNSFEVDVCIFQNCDPKTDKIDRHTSNSCLAKVRYDLCFIYNITYSIIRDEIPNKAVK